MAKSSARLKKLRDYYADTAGAVDWNSFNAEIQGASDRAAIIILASLLEDALELVISRRMPHLKINEREELFEFNGPIGSFSSRIKIAHAFGFIDIDMRRRLDEIRAMRNACAHSKKQISLATPELKDVAVNGLSDADANFVGLSDGNVRNAFISSVFHLYNLIVADPVNRQNLYQILKDMSARLPKPLP